ncbi:hypothetical protein [Phenylobacterium sp.]|jgi:hypothetical protein|uniref:hypothetical protein n=1 Tax=Phenylobacterium sp. TaxID=1871053 RepID=UPI0037C82927
MEHDDAYLAGEGDLVRDDDRMLEETGADPEMFELELDGQVHTLPAALKGAVLRQADYTRKTQELAEHRRALEAEREALAARVNAHQGASRDEQRLAALDEQIEDFQAVDWEGYAAEDPEGAQASWSTFQRLAQAREQLAYAVSHHQERSALQAAREAAEAMAETGRKLSEEIEGWSPEVAGKLVDYAQAFGVTMEELREMADPRLWKLLHKAWRADQASEVGARETAQAVRPAVSISGGGGGAGGVRDELATKEWMRRRNEQMARGR